MIFMSLYLDIKHAGVGDRSSIVAPILAYLAPKQSFGDFDFILFSKINGSRFAFIT